MNVVFRCDASIQIGTGHVMRCLTLADELLQQGAKCHFICREHEGNLIDFITQKGYATYSLPLEDNTNELHSESEIFHAHWLGTSQLKDALQASEIVTSINPEWIIVDHYALDKTWEEKLKNYTKAILVIDDLADRHHDCDILVDQTYGRKNLNYNELTPTKCCLLCGTKYALLRPEFSNWRKYSLQRRQNGELNHILINLGGVDKDNITSEILESLKEAQLPNSCHITVVMGSTAPWVKAVKHKALELPWLVEVKLGVSNMAELMANSDLAIGAAGSTSWERCCLGLPTIMLVIAENQINVAEELKQAKAVKVAYINNNLSINIVNYLHHFVNNPKSLKAMSQYGAELLDGLGSYRVINEMKNIYDES